MKNPKSITTLYLSTPFLIKARNTIPNLSRWVEEKLNEYFKQLEAENIIQEDELEKEWKHNFELNKMKSEITYKTWLQEKLKTNIEKLKVKQKEAEDNKDWELHKSIGNEIKRLQENSLVIN